MGGPAKQGRPRQLGKAKNLSPKLHVRLARRPTLVALCERHAPKNGTYEDTIVFPIHFCINHLPRSTNFDLWRTPEVALKFQKDARSQIPETFWRKCCGVPAIILAERFFLTKFIFFLQIFFFLQFFFDKFFFLLNFF